MGYILELLRKSKQKKRKKRERKKRKNKIHLRLDHIMIPAKLIGVKVMTQAPIFAGPMTGSISGSNLDNNANDNK